MVHTFLDEVPYIIIGALVLLIFAGLSFLFRRLIHGASHRAHLNLMLADVFARLTQSATIIIGVLVAAVVVVPSFNLGSLVAGLGISSVAIGFAFKDILQNFFAGILLLWRQPFRIGDQIKVNNYEGTVEEITAQSTVIKTYAGEKVIIPNSEVYISPILQFTAYDKVRGEFDVPIDPNVSVDRVKQVILDALRKTEGVLADPPPAVYLAELTAASVNLRVHFWTKPMRGDLMTARDIAISKVKNALDRTKVAQNTPEPANAGSSNGQH